jgi:hypothetical protein
MIDINSPNGISTCCWGPPLWAFMHMSALNFRKEDASAYRRFLLALKAVLPCKACRDNYDHNLIAAGFNLKKSWVTRKGYFTMIYQLHRAVSNSFGGRKTCIPTLEEVARSFERTRARCGGVGRVGGGSSKQGCELPSSPDQRGLRAQVRFVFKRPGDEGSSRFRCPSASGMHFPTKVSRGAGRS